MALDLANRISPELGVEVANQIMAHSGQGSTMTLGAPADIELGEQEHPYVERARDEARASTQVD
jgi:hypothetical protein